MKRNLQLIQSSTLPKSPNNVDGINRAYLDPSVQRNYSLTDRSDETQRTMLFKTAFECGDFSFCVFSSDTIVDAIKENIAEEKRKYYIDGTFKITPQSEFVQVVNISIDFLGQVSSKNE